VYKTIQDASGFIWAITDNGIVKYNGHTFKVFTTKDGLPTNDIWEIETTADGKVWFFCKASKIGYIENDEVYTFEGQERNRVFFPLRIITSKNQVLFDSTDDWFFLNEQNKWQGISSVQNHPLGSIQSKVDSIVDTEGPKNIIHLRAKDSLIFWVTSNSYNVLNTNTNSLTTGNPTLGFTKSLSSFARINQINGKLQIADKDYLAVLDNQYAVSEEFTIPNTYNAHFAILDTSNNLWATSLQNGIFKIPGMYQKLDYYFPNEKVKSIRKLGDEIVVNVFNKGYLKYTASTKEFKSFIEEKGVLNPLNIMDSLQRFDFIHKLNMTSYDLQSSRPIKTIKLSEGVKQTVYKDGFIWGFGSFDIKKMKASTMEVLERYPAIGTNKIVVYNNKILIGSTEGLFQLKDHTIQSLTNYKEFQNPVSNMIRINDTWLLIGTEGQGAYATNLEEVVVFPKTDLLNIQDAYVKDDTIWLATNEGLLEFTYEGDTFQFVQNITETLDFTFQKTNAVYVEEETIFLGTDSGLFVFPKNTSIAPQFLDLYFESVFFNEISLEQITNEVEFTTNNSLRVAVSNIDYSEKNSPMTYQYKLEPIQNEWIETASSSLNFSELSPNDYQLRLKRGTVEKTISVSILPLWWQTTVFKIFAGLLLLGLVLLILYLIRKFELNKKTAKLNAQKKLAEYELYALRSQMNPHFVFNSLAAIQYYINQNDMETSDTYLVKFSRLIRQFFEISKVEEITLEDEVELLKNYLEIEKLRFREKLNYEVTIDDHLDIKKNTIPSMLLQPIVENAVNHGIFNKEESGTIYVNFSQITSAKYRVDIIDDGVGVEKTIKPRNGKLSSSIVLNDRISILNQSQNWDINFTNQEAFSNATNKGNKASFIIHNLR